MLLLKAAEWGLALLIEQKLDVAGSAKANDKVIGTRGFVAGSVTTDTAKAVFSTDITNKGFYIPRLTTTQKNSLGLTLNATNKGLLVFDTTLNRTDLGRYCLESSG
ncbi:MAG: hypothetical protein U0T72_09780 [Chitinophagales bacterium]